MYWNEWAPFWSPVSSYCITVHLRFLVQISLANMVDWLDLFSTGILLQCGVNCSGDQPAAFQAEKCE